MKICVKTTRSFLLSYLFMCFCVVIPNIYTKSNFLWPLNLHGERNFLILERHWKRRERAKETKETRASYLQVADITSVNWKDNGQPPLSYFQPVFFSCIGGNHYSRSCNLEQLISWFQWEWLRYIKMGIVERLSIMRKWGQQNVIICTPTNVY